jgi:lipopolysaccharide export system permease protein
LLHARFQQPLLCIVAALIGFSTLLLGNFSRFGVWRQIVAALVLLVIVKMIEGVVAAPVRADPAFWPLIYLPTIVGLAISAALLAIVARPRRKPLRARPEPPAEMGAT